MTMTEDERTRTRFTTRAARGVPQELRGWGFLDAMGAGCLADLTGHRCGAPDAPPCQPPSDVEGKRVPTLWVRPPDGYRIYLAHSAGDFDNEAVRTLITFADTWALEFRISITPDVDWEGYLPVLWFPRDPRDEGCFTPVKWNVEHPEEVRAWRGASASYRRAAVARYARTLTHGVPHAAQIVDELLRDLRLDDPHDPSKE
jgi:hypothetical protein